MTISNNEHTPDVIDRASQLEMAYTEGLIRETQMKVQQQQAPREDGSFDITDCVQCGNEIGIGRLRAAAKNFYCIECATRNESITRRR